MLCYFNGKSYKLSIKKNCYNFRFNRANKTIFTYKNLNISNKRGLKKLYIFNLLSPYLRKKMVNILFRIRKYNTHTLRGIHTNTTSLNKRQGRISGYM
jgi:phosphorylcholine metabolism protein LicD